MNLGMKNINMLDNIWHMYVVIYIRLIIIFEYANYLESGIDGIIFTNTTFQVVELGGLELGK